MKKYLLLRDNKQSGPYSVEELVAKGIKPYDLVWLEGKSAAWRYPSEMEDLKPYAPVVEEQPYDRFYKKPALATADVVTDIPPATTQQQQAITTPVIPVAANKPVQPAASRKIYVTLPAASGKTAASTTTATKKETVIPAEKETPVAKVELPKTAAALTPVEPVTSFAAIVDQHYQPKETTTLPVFPRKQKADTYKLLLRGIVAACLLLGGVVIGIAITYTSRDNGNQVALDRLVQQLQEKEKQKQSSPAVLLPAPSIHETATQPTANNTAALVGATSSGEAEKATMPAQKGQRNLAADQTLTGAVKTPEVKIVPAVVTQPQEEKPTAQTHSPENTSPANRENIYRQVAVEASTFKTGVLGGISELYFTISNKSPFPLEMVEVEIKYLGPEKRVVKVQRLLFNDLAAGARKTLEAPRTNRGVTIDYVITKINSKALGIARVGS